MAWIAWKKVCSSFNCGGLGIGSLQALNVAMMAKWWWRFHIDDNALWKKVINSIHGTNGVIGLDTPYSRMHTCPWKTICDLNKYISLPNFNLKDSFRKKLGTVGVLPCGMTVGSVLLISKFDPTDLPDSWECNLDPSMLFTVSSLRRKIDSVYLLTQDDQIRWNKDFPIKVNIHSWRLRFDRLPTRVNLDMRGIDLHSTRCPVCDGAIETSYHLFVECEVASNLWNSIKVWWGLNHYPSNLPTLVSWAKMETNNGNAKSCLDVVIQTTNWVIWRYRNRICFDLKPSRKDALLEEIKVLSHSWILHRNKNK